VHEELNFCTAGSRDRGFGIWALQYSADGRELVAGTSDQSIYIYDMALGKAVLRVKAHEVRSFFLFFSFFSFGCKVCTTILGRWEGTGGRYR